MPINVTPPQHGGHSMLLYIFTVFTALKLATWRIKGNGNWLSGLTYGTMWIGMNPNDFLQRRNDKIDCRSGTGFLLTGTSLAMSLNYLQDDIYRAIFLFISMLFMVHFGLLDLNARFWQKMGRAVKPIMNAPWKATSLSEFWGRRWNMAFRDSAYLLVFKPMIKKWGATTAAFSVFCFSGLVHEIIMSVPAGGGYGGPMAYFIVQFLGLHLQKSHHYFNSAWLSWLFILLPLPMLFHPPFLLNVFLPLAKSIGG